MKSRFFKLNQWLNKPFSKLMMFAASATLISACSMVPETVDVEQPDTNFVRVAQAPDAFVGYEVRWGGIVARVENLEQDTLVEIVNLPLDSRARPLGNVNTSGRFIARVQGFLDPLIYKQGKEITIVGVLNDPMPGQIGQHQVNFPVVDSTGHHLWEQRQSHQHISVFSSWDPFWFGHVGYRWRYPYYGYPRYNYCPVHGAFHHHNVRHIVRNHNRHSDTQLNAAPSPTHRVQPLSEQRVEVGDVERVTLRERPQSRVTPNKPLQIAPAKPVEIRRPEPPKRPTRIHPKIHKVKIPKPTAPRDPRRVEKLR